MGLDAGIAMLYENGDFKTEIFDRYRVFSEAYTEMQYVTQLEMIALLISCMKEAADEFHETHETKEFFYRIHWIQECLSIVENNGDIKYSIFKDSEDHEKEDFTKP